MTKWDGINKIFKKWLAEHTVEIFDSQTNAPMAMKKNQAELNKSILFQVPHHGSKENWHDWFTEYQPYCKFWPVTNNANHKYNRRGIFPSATFSFVAPYSITAIESTKFGLQIYFIECKDFS